MRASRPILFFMDIREAYNHWSDSYDQDRNLTRDLDEQVTRQVLAGWTTGPILEIGCGTGKNTAWLAGLGGQVLALDFSDGMLRRAREKVQAENVTFQAADLTQPWPCRDASVRLVVCNLVLEHIQDLGFIFGQAARVLQAGGRFFVCELHPFRQYQGIQANFQGQQGPVHIPALSITCLISAPRLQARDWPWPS